MEQEPEFCVFFSNLEDRAPQSGLVALIISFIFQTTGILVSKRDVSLRHSDLHGCHTARVDLHDSDLQCRVVEAARLSNSAPNGLVKRGRVLRADYYRPRLLNHTLYSLPSGDDPPMAINNSSAETQKSGTAIQSPIPPKDPLTRIDNSAAEKQDAGRATFYPTAPNLPLVYTGEPRMHFLKNQQLGNETRSLEFKRGGGDFKKYLRKHLTKYICAFLNSEGGTLMIGVDDGGFVQGVFCDHQTEDQVRLMIDQLIGHFDPPVLPQMYRLDFIPVKDPHSTEADPDVKVVEIVVRSGRSNILYETPEGEVFIRRDGGVQGPLRPKEIQEWCHMKFSQEHQERENALRLQMDTLEARLGKIERLQSQQAHERQGLISESSTDAFVAATNLTKSSPSHEDPLAQTEPHYSPKRSNSRVCIIL
ncbi:uncharacterized protein LOC110975297 [Acanthaster planci]|uniref:Uncharacterized protein LOC110975297 n=1 Tax=Acanthaster planci TaxID=133434 RepID=A0A8B7XR86_ACAPL|nr:uncharacterized protein LOC110975297 [Acanthaster planci]XP_022083360.1 uncharacterized protein LOC110975297 [Acanthaster planci]